MLATGYLTSSDLSGRVARLGEVFGGVEAAERPVTAEAVTSGRSILAIGAELRGPGSDSDPDSDPDSGSTAGSANGPGDGPIDAPADDPAPGGVGRPPAGAVMLIRFDPRDDSASVISIPYLTRVDVPGHGRTTIASAHTLGGPTLLVRTVEQLTSVRVDHFMVVDFDELAPVVDVLGGVDVTVAADITDRTGVRFRAGVNRLDGARARAYLRQPDDLPDGTADRTQRRQNLLRAVLTRVASAQPDADALENYRLLDAVTRAVSVDDRFGRDKLRDVARAAAGASRGSIWFLVAPTRSTTGGGVEGAGSEPYLLLEPGRSVRLWHAFRTGTVEAYISAHPEDLLSTNPG